MKIWAIADPHLSFGVPNKKMDVFGAHWERSADKIAEHWQASIAPEDLVLIAGDISWAMKLEEARPDLEWIGYLPGTKVLIKGNHDYWWSSMSKNKTILPPSCHLIQNNSVNWQGIAIGGTRLWDVPGLSFKDVIIQKDPEKKAPIDPALMQEKELENIKIYGREIERLEISLKSMDKAAKKRIVMTHYPPIGTDLKETEASLLFEKYQVDIVVFGHLHNVKPDLQLFGTARGVTYHLTACDYLDFKPLLIL